MSNPLSLSYSRENINGKPFQQTDVASSAIYFLLLIRHKEIQQTFTKVVKTLLFDD